MIYSLKIYEILMYAKFNSYGTKVKTICFDIFLCLLERLVLFLVFFLNNVYI